jgi:YfiH family protein
VIVWPEPGYVAAFTTRIGGISDGPHASLNLAGSGDDPRRVAENRRLACEALSLDAELLAANRQVHSATVLRAGGRDAARGGTADGLWTDERGVPLLALTADCVPIAIVRTGGRPAVAALHAGWRGLAAGIVEAGVAALGGGAKAAAIGPSIGPCCYTVGPEVSERYDPDLTVDGKLDLWRAAERRLAAAGVARVDRFAICTHCHPELFFSHRRTGQPRGTQGVFAAVA